MDIDYKMSRPETALILPLQDPYNQHPQAIQQIGTYIRTKGIRRTGPTFGRYDTPESETPRNNLFWEVGIPVETATDADPPYKIREMKPQRVDSVIFKDPANMEKYARGVFLMKLIIEDQFPTHPGIEIWHNRSGKSRTELQIDVIKVYP